MSVSCIGNSLLIAIDLDWLTHWTMGDVVVILKCNLRIKFLIKFMSTSSEIALRWKPQLSFDDKSPLIQIMAWCHQAMLTQIYIAIWCP